RVELGEQALHHAEQEDAGGDGHRDADQAGDHRDGERLDDEQGQSEGVEPLGRQQDPGQTGQPGAHRPRQGGDAVGVDGGQLRQLTAVDDGADLSAEVGVAEQQVQQNTDHGNEDDDGEPVLADQQVVGD